MLVLHIPTRRVFHDEESKFITLDPVTLKMEHSLLSISKWESKYEIPYLSNNKKTRQQVLDYMRCMTIHPNNLDDQFFETLSSEHISEIEKYINKSMTATIIKEDKTNPRSREILTSELIYYWMISFNIPFDCEKWHLNRLLILITICGIKNSPQKKMSKRAILERNRQLNEVRRTQFNNGG